MPVSTCRPIVDATWPRLVWTTYSQRLVPVRHRASTDIDFPTTSQRGRSGRRIGVQLISSGCLLGGLPRHPRRRTGTTDRHPARRHSLLFFIVGGRRATLIGSCGLSVNALHACMLVCFSHNSFPSLFTK